MAWASATRPSLDAPLAGFWLKLAMRRMPGLEAAIVAHADHIAAMAQPHDVNARIIRFPQASV